MGLVTMHNKLNEILFAEMLAGRRFVLIVDEAQNLDDSVLETIRLLSNFETSHTKLLQIVLAGQPQLGDKLGQQHLAQLLQRITLVQHLKPLTPEETVGYIRHRLKVAGHSGEPLFEPDAMALIAERSQGVPRNINKICFRSLLEAYARGRDSVSSDMVEMASRKLNVLETSRPAPAQIPPQIPAPTPATADFVEAVVVPVAPNLSYTPRQRMTFPRWNLWAGALFVAVLLAGLALSRNLPRVMMQRVRAQVTASKTLLQRSPTDDARQTPAIRESPQGSVAVKATLVEQGSPTVTAIQATGSDNDAQVVVMLDDSVRYESARITSPDRIYFDLHKARLSPSVGQKTVPVEKGLLKWVRAGQNTDEVVRLVLDANGAKDYSAQLLSDPHRLVINLHAQPVTAEKRDLPPNPSKPFAAGASPEAITNRQAHLSLARELGLKIKRIAIDPGHGGYDTGTVGPRGLLEKNLCLDVALRLGQLIEQNIPDAEVLYTRKDDRHVPLEERTAIANNANADLFISIHANSSGSREARGVETYYMSLATSQESRELAMRENALAQSSLRDLPALIEKITRNEKIVESKLLAADIQNTLSQRLQLVSLREKNRGVKQAPFVVLTGANMPAVLSEISFVSNASDENLLFEGSQRQRVAEGLYRGIAAYLDSLRGLPPQKQKLVTENRNSSLTGSETPTSDLRRNPQ
jgi:N-acetylmuramoyl-L-alanine amidase